MDGIVLREQEGFKFARGLVLDLIISVEHIVVIKGGDLLIFLGLQISKIDTLIGALLFLLQ